MSRASKSSGSPASANARGEATIEVSPTGEAVLITVSGLVDERFAGFGNLDAPKVAAVDVSRITRMTSFGVRQWLKAITSLPKSITDLYLLGCPTFFVDQLNMVLNFGGPSKVLTVTAPYTCPACGVESGELIDILVERANVVKGVLPEKECARCGGKLEFDETPESYFAFVSRYGPTSIHPAAAQLLSSLGRYTAAGIASDKPPRIIKLVHGSVTYFRIIGTIGSLFRSRPFLVGAEGQVVIDLAEVDRFEVAGLKEWRRLLKSLAAQVPAVTLVDVSESFLILASDTLALARNITVASVLVPYACVDCGRTAHESETLLTKPWPRTFEEHVCATCGGTTRSKLSRETLLPLQTASTNTPTASAKMIEQRDEILSRAHTNANVAQAGDRASAALDADDIILGKYKIVRRLSAGGMAEVFLANQVGIGGFEKPVALKRIQHKLLDSRQQAIELFLNEAKIAGRLTHPNIVQVLDVGEVSGALYLAMEYVHGRDLRDVLKTLHRERSLMPLAEACYVIREIAQALHHAYWSTDMAGKQMSVVHRDVSPHNVILGYDGTVKLLDFGVAMSAVTEHAETMIVGKWMYMSPETTMNEQIDHRSDLYSLGVIFYLLCSGSMPFSGREPKEIVKKIRAGQYKPLQEVNPDVPDRLAKLVARMLSGNPDDRPQRGQEVVTELTEIVRQYGIESSAQNIADFLSHVFPSTLPAAPPEPKVKEIIRVYPDEAVAASATASRRSGSIEHASIDKSPVSITPSAVTSAKLVDVSETFRRPSVPALPARPSSPFPAPVVRPQPSTPVQRDEASSQGRRNNVVRLVVLLAVAAVLGVVSYLEYLTY